MYLSKCEVWDKLMNWNKHNLNSHFWKLTAYIWLSCTTSFVYKMFWKGYQYWIVICKILSTVEEAIIVWSFRRMYQFRTRYVFSISIDNSEFEVVDIFYHVD